MFRKTIDAVVHRQRRKFTLVGMFLCRFKCKISYRPDCFESRHAHGTIGNTRGIRAFVKHHYVRRGSAAACGRREIRRNVGR